MLSILAHVGRGVNLASPLAKYQQAAERKVERLRRRSSGYDTCQPKTNRPTDARANLKHLLKAGGR